MEQELLRRRPVLRPRLQTLLDEVLLLLVVQRLYRLPDVLVGHLGAGVTVADDLEGGHLQCAHAERVDVDRWAVVG